MASKHWTWHFEQPPAEVWAVLADTARYNVAAGFPKHAIEEVADDEGFVTYFAHARIGPFDIDWEEVPVDWVAGQRFEHARRFKNGPLRGLTATLELAPADGGTRADYVLEAEPRGLAGRLFVPFFLAGAARSFDRLMGEARRFLAGDADEPFRPPPFVPDRPARTRIERTVETIEATGNGHGLAARLGDYLCAAPEIDLEHLRPLRLARLWRTAPRAVIELCLQAVKSGLLGMDWVLLCPRCRGAKSTAPSLDRLPTDAHCAACNIDYGRDFQRNVELTFRPADWLRPIAQGEYCLFGPMSTPHVVLQQTLAPGESRDLKFAPSHGAYRLRTLSPGAQADIDFTEGGFPEVIADAAGARPGPPAPSGVVRLTNAGARPVTVIVEQRQWVAEALTAHRVTTLQAFRDLFPGEALRPGDEVSVERVALMFTDLKNSTALYERLGDAAAFDLVRAHFAFLAAIMRAHDGAIVKTIGDAVMAVFAEPGDALAAALAVQRGIGDFDAGGNEVVLKLGLHLGPAVAVRLNERLDYFGGTVNMAARLQAQSRGGDIVLSRQIAADPAVAAMLASFKPRRERAALKGFARPVPYLRLTPAQIP